MGFKMILFIAAILVIATLDPGAAHISDRFKCGENKELRICGSSCEKNCDHPYGIQNCVVHCAIGCFCKEGFLKDRNNKCIPADECGLKDT